MSSLQFNETYFWLKYLKLYCPSEWWIFAVNSADNNCVVCALVEVQWIDVTAISMVVQIGGKGNLKDRVATCDCLEGIQI